MNFFSKVWNFLAYKKTHLQKIFTHHQSCNVRTTAEASGFPPRLGEVFPAVFVAATLRSAAFYDNFVKISFQHSKAGRKIYDHPCRPRAGLKPVLVEVAWHLTHCVASLWGRHSRAVGMCDFGVRDENYFHNLDFLILLYLLW